MLLIYLDERYSWGHKSPDGTFKNQVKVRELKNLLMARGFKVWVDMDHFEDFDGDEVGWAEEVCYYHSAMVN